MKDFKTAFISGGNDYFAALERVAGDEALLLDLMRMFLADGSFSVMREKIAEGEINAAFRAAHSLKGSCGMLGMTALYNSMLPLTEELRRGNPEGAKMLYPAAEREYNSVVGLLECCV